ncbi:MAG: cobalamin ECF transporter [Enterococcus lacertideformus]|uniref:Cobalamin ECF transporter n=1 Tax=Enterococcus lacertideformus TaxID=2771493 RepID=A0A931FCP6_9ENTE|nr:cobalamin ECF transporter [Enterococcus lacertideformus]
MNPLKSRFTIHQFTYLSLLTAACVVGQIIFVWLPNVQPMTAILLLLACYGSLTDALIVSLLSLFITNLYLGLGTWTISQMIAFSGIVLFFHLVSKIPLMAKHLFLQAFFSFFCGIFYGLIVSRIETLFYQIPSFWVYYFQGLPFDLAHGIGNFFFYLMLFPLFQRVIFPLYSKRSGL